MLKSSGNKADQSMYFSYTGEFQKHYTIPK